MIEVQANNFQRRYWPYLFRGFKEWLRLVWNKGLYDVRDRNPGYL